jgi:hypothetical protein
LVFAAAETLKGFESLLKVRETLRTNAVARGYIRRLCNNHLKQPESSRLPALNLAPAGGGNRQSEYAAAVSRLLGFFMLGITGLQIDPIVLLSAKRRLSFRPASTVVSETHASETTIRITRCADALWKFAQV